MIEGVDCMHADGVVCSYVLDVHLQCYHGEVEGGEMDVEGR